MDTNQEAAFVRAFIVPEKQERYLFFLANPKRRRKILGTLYHTLSVVGSRTTRITGSEHFPEPLEAMLKRKGAGPTCYLISPNSSLDQREMPLREALDTLIMEDCTAVACCLPGRLACYKAEQGVYLLEYNPPLA